MTIKAVLFDIDGTLVNCQGAGKNSLIQACLDVFGTIGRMKKVDFQGKTDPLILKESLSIMGFDEDMINKNIEKLKQKYFNYLDTYMYDNSSIILPGVKELLEKLSINKTIILGLQTGNFTESAKIKLKRFDLNKYFKFGVFGDDAAIRNHMPDIAKKRLKNEFNLDIDYKKMIFIGDTVYDIECAKTAGAVSISVGTGWSDKNILLSHNPDYFFDDLSDTENIVDTILHH